MYIYDRDGRVIPDYWFNKAKATELARMIRSAGCLLLR